MALIRNEPCITIAHSWRLLMVGWIIGFVLLLLTPIEALSSSTSLTQPQQPNNNNHQQQQSDQTASSSSSSSSLQGNASLRKKIAGSIAKGERRARERSRGGRPVCEGCQRPPRLCLCPVLPSKPFTIADTPARILILQHPNEFRKRHLSTVPLMKLVLDDSILTIKVGYQFDFTRDIQPLLLENQGDGSSMKFRRPLLLYPGPDAWDLDNYYDHYLETERRMNEHPPDVEDEDDLGDECCSKETTNKELPPPTLIVMDGTWTEAKRMVRDSSGLVENCQGVQFTSHQSSLYEPIRQEPDQHCLSTLEACALAMEKMNAVETSRNTSMSVSECLRTVMARHVQLHVQNAATLVPRFNQDGRSHEDKRARMNELEAAMMDSDSSSNNNNAINKIPHSTSFTPTVPLPEDDGVTMRLLTLADAPLIDSWWEHQSVKSLKMVYRTLQTNHGFCLGIVGPDSTLRACIVRYEQGAIGMLHTRKEFRGRGYGTALLTQVTHLLEERHLPCVAFIRDGNTASEAVFTKAGWVKEHPNAKKAGTGKRRANRKWIKRNDLPE